MNIKQIIKNNKFKKITKWTGIVIGSLFILVLILVVVLYFILRAGALTQTALTKINPVANAFGVNISRLDNATIDLLGEIDINGLSLTWEDEVAGNARLDAKQIRLQYVLGDLISSKLTVNEILLKDINIKASLNPQPSEELPEESKPLDLAKLEELLVNPPLPINLQRLALDNINFDIAVNDSKASQNLNGSLEKLHTEVQWDNDKLHLNTRLLINKEQNQSWKISSSATDIRSDIEMMPRWDTNIDLALHNSKQIWNLARLNVSQNIKLENISISNVPKDIELTQINAKAIVFNLNTEQNSNQKTSHKKGLEGLFPLSLTTKIESNINGLQIAFYDADGSQIKMSNTNNLHIAIDNTINTLNPLKITSQYKLSESLDVNELALEAPVQKVGINKLLLNLATTGSALLNGDVISDIQNKTKLQLSSGQIDFLQNSENDLVIKASLQPNITIESDIRAPGLEELNLAKVKVNADISLSDIDALIKNKDNSEHYSVKQNSVNVDAAYQDQQAEVFANIEIDHADVPQLKKPVSLNNQIKLNSDIEAKQGELDLAVSLQKEQILNSLIKFNNDQDTLTLAHQIKLNLPLWLEQIHDEAKALQQIGHTNVVLNGQSQVTHGAMNIQTANPDQAEQWPVATKGQINIIQKTKPTVADSVIIKDSLVVGYDVQKAKQIKTTLKVTTAGVQAGPLLEPMPINLTNETQLTWPLTKTHSKGTLDIDNENALAFDLSFVDKPQFIALLGKITVSENPEWQRYIAEFKQAEDVGKLTVVLNPDIKVKHPAKTVLEFNADNPEALTADITLKLDVSQDQRIPANLVKIIKPVQLTQKLNWENKALNASTDFFIGEVSLPDLATVRALPGSIKIKTAGGLDPNAINANVILEEGNISYFEKTEEKTNELKLGKAVTPLRLELQADKSDEFIALKKLAVDLGQGLLQLNADGTLGIKGDFAQIKLDAGSDLDQNQLSELGFNSKGKFSLPLELNYANNADVSINGTFHFDNFSISNNDFTIDQLNGQIQLNEELITQNNLVAFKYMLDTDPFQRVDFSRIQPYLDSNSNLSFSSIQSGDIAIGPGMVNLAIDQNLIKIQRMDLDIFGGQVLAQVYIDARPKAQKFGLLSRISRVDPRVLLPETSQQKQARLAPISARTALNFSLADRLMEGKIDVTKISKDQLLQLLEFVDPEHKDDQIETVRSALRFAHPQNVSVEMVSGLMNLAVEVSTLPKPIAIRGLPLTPLIQQSAGDIEKILTDLPLKELSELSKEGP